MRSGCASYKLQLLQVLYFSCETSKATIFGAGAFSLFVSPMRLRSAAAAGAQQKIVMMRSSLSSTSNVKRKEYSSRSLLCPFSVG